MVRRVAAVTAMACGRIMRFNNILGYGFIEQDGGGEDVFVHLADLSDATTAARPGTRVQFNVIRGERGLKATDVKVIGAPGQEPPATARALPASWDDSM